MILAPVQVTPQQRANQAAPAYSLIRKACACGKAKHGKCAACALAANRAAVQPMAALPNELNTLRYPSSMTAALADVLGLPNFRTGPIADVYRAAGAKIRTKCEDEQAFVLDRYLRLAIEHGDEWRTAAAADLKAAHTLAEASKAVES